MVGLVRLIIAILFSVGTSVLGSVILGLLSQGYTVGSFVLFSFMVGLVFVAFTALEKSGGNNERV